MSEEVLDQSATPAGVAAARHVPIRRVRGGDLNTLIDLEWLVTNGLGGYACGTVSGAATRRYHGLLIGAHPAPLGRVMMWNHLTEYFRLPDFRGVAVGGAERVGGRVEVDGAAALTEFRLELGLPVWRFEIADCVIEKRVWLPHRQNTVHVSYRLVAGSGPIRLKLRPSVHFRGHDDPVSHLPKEPYVLTASEGRFELNGGAPWPRLRFQIVGDSAALTLDGVKVPDVLYRIEENRGYEGVGVLWSPGVFRVDLHPSREVTLERVDREMGTIHSPLGGEYARGGSRSPTEADCGGGPYRAGRFWGRAGPGRRPVHHHCRPAASTTRPAPTPPATKRARSSPAITGSPTGAATP